MYIYLSPLKNKQKQVPTLGQPLSIFRGFNCSILVLRDQTAADCERPYTLVTTDGCGICNLRTGLRSVVGSMQPVAQWVGAGVFVLTKRTYQGEGLIPGYGEFSLLIMSYRFSVSPEIIGMVSWT